MSGFNGFWAPGPGPTEGDDEFLALAASVQLDALGGDDTLTGGWEGDVLNGNDGNDTLNGQSGNDLLLGGAGNDTLGGMDGDDTITGDDGDDSLQGGDGNDSLLPGAGADVIDGGTGTLDVVSYEDATAAVGITIQGANDILTGGAAAGDTIANVEGFIGSNFGDSIIATSGGYALYGGGGGDTIVGGDQASTIDGGSGGDSLVGSLLQDTMVGGAGSDTLFGMAAPYAGGVGDTLIGGYWDPSTGEVFDDRARDFMAATVADTVFAGQGDVAIGGGAFEGNQSIAFLPSGYMDSGQDTVITFPGVAGTPEPGTFDVWTNLLQPGSAPIYLTGFGFYSFYPGTVCFATGTRIATSRGEVAVEDLRVGDLVVTAHGGAPLQPVVWLGHTRTNVARHPDRARVAPVLIKAGALADGVPARDLRVSPDHAMSIDGHLVPSRLLVNGTSIVQEMWCPEVTYWHVELPAHGLLVSEGAVSESYFDDGNRKHFDNYGITTLFKDFESERGNGRYAENACQPVMAEGAMLDRIRARIAARDGAATGRRRA